MPRVDGAEKRLPTIMVGKHKKLVPVARSQESPGHSGIVRLKARELSLPYLITRNRKRS